MVCVALERAMSCTPEEYLEYVMDVTRYTAVDDKIGKISWVRRDGNLLEFKFQPKLPGLPLPEPKAVAHMRLTPGRQVDVALAPLPQNKFNHLMARFDARFSCEATETGIRATRMISFRFNPLVRWLLDPLLRRRLTESVERELLLTQRELERASTDGE